jgi:iron-regulated transporter 1
LHFTSFTAAQTTLLVQNCSVVLCSGILISFLFYEEEIDKLWNGALRALLIVSILLISTIANLGSEANKIALEKDWIVVLAGGNQEKLASYWKLENFLNFYL